MGIITGDGCYDDTEGLSGYYCSAFVHSVAAVANYYNVAFSVYQVPITSE